MFTSGTAVPLPSDDLEAAGAALRAATTTASTAAPHGALRVPGKAHSRLPSWLCPKRERRSGEVGLLLMGRDGAGAEAEAVEESWARLRALKRKTAQLWREQRCFFMTMGLSEIGLFIGLGFLAGELNREMFRHEFLGSCEATSRAVLAGVPVPLAGRFSSCPEALTYTAEHRWSLKSATEVSTIGAVTSGLFGDLSLLGFLLLFLLGVRDSVDGYDSRCTYGSSLGILIFWYLFVGIDALTTIGQGQKDGEIYACQALNATTFNATTFDSSSYCGVFGSPELPTSQAMGWLLGGGTLMIAVATLLVACLYRGSLTTERSAAAIETERDTLHDGLRGAERAGGGAAAADGTGTACSTTRFDYGGL